MGERDARLLGRQVRDPRVGDPEPDVAAVLHPPGDEVLEHLVLGVHRHRPSAAQLGEVDSVHPAAERQVDALVDEPVAHHPVPHAGLAHEVDRALLQDSRLDRLLDRLAGLQVDHHRLHTPLVQQVRQH
jgi:hypothetical protein